ncbi:hypothetical protein DFR69_115179 [Nocardia neocaledoniensis]|uniref:Uncharacterized protein n=1 Tax=Nocardia neocaledoniensis TaxID=236511 RepID=A0A317N3V5_9NOCA|nr:hypothetical protein DFR69_115179 [Nocardia neocaledoniensis]
MSRYLTCFGRYTQLQHKNGFKRVMCQFRFGMSTTHGAWIRRFRAI